MKGIVLAGGTGTRLYPATVALSKQLLPVYDKPMIYYPMSVLMLAGIRDILIISSPGYSEAYKRIFDDGSAFGLTVKYAVQDHPGGIAQAFLVGRDFIGGSGAALVLGDNLFFGAGLTGMLQEASGRSRGATVFAYHVQNPERYGVIDYGPDTQPRRIVEKPRTPPSPWAVTGLYFYDNRVLDIAAALKPSARGELEITDVNSRYLEMGELHVRQLPRGFAWFDTGTHESLLEASQFVHAVQKRTRSYVACLEEIAYLRGFIDRATLVARGKLLASTEYGRYLLALADEEPQ